MKLGSIIIFLFLISSPAQAQIDISKVSADFGFASNHQSDFGNDKLFALSPELKIGGNFIKSNFEWDIYISYWDDLIDKPFHIIDGVTYSYSSASVGLRLNYFPKYILIPIHFMLGFSSQLVLEKYVGGLDISGRHRDGSNYFLITFDVGVGFDIALNDYMRLRLDALAFLPFREEEYLFLKGYSNSLKIGVDYFINK